MELLITILAIWLCISAMIHAVAFDEFNTVEPLYRCFKTQVTWFKDRALSSAFRNVISIPFMLTLAILWFTLRAIVCIPGWIVLGIYHTLKFIKVVKLIKFLCYKDLP